MSKDLESKTWIDDITDQEQRKVYQRVAELCYRCIKLKGNTSSTFAQWAYGFRRTPHSMVGICEGCPYAMEIMLIQEQGVLVTWIDDLPDAKRRQALQRIAEICFSCYKRSGHSGGIEEWVFHFKGRPENMIWVCDRCPYAMEIMFIKEDAT